ncbi:DNA replication/repair protein RecF [Spirosoma soli]|uniref:DNA replication and repair protein RecF n=1 Tax=Spirosoma soli TaxID=1770529 RepID=A0ABW5MBA9_9BACT
MHLEKLSLTNFKNYEDIRYTFGRQVNVIVGPNGSGKTNLLDAVYFLALSKSAFQSQDALSILHDADYFIIDGIFEEDTQPGHERPVQITISLQRGQRKVLMADKKPYERVSEHIGRFPVVLMAPNDTDLVREHSEDRRHFFDGVLSQLDPDYLRDYLMYQQVLKQRNSLLKLFAEPDRRTGNQVDNDLLDTYDKPLLEIGQRIHDRRQQFVLEFLPSFQKHYAYLSEEREAVDIVYESEVSNPDFASEFRHFRRRDTVLQRTTMGVHKDDYSFIIGGVPLKKFGSQGQQKTFVIALKLAQFDQLEAKKDIKPILLLDDIFDKLDDRRISKLIQRMDEGAFGQLFITDARPERTRELLHQVKADVRFFETGRS